MIEDISKRNYDVGNDIVNTIINYYFRFIEGNCDIRVEGYIGEDVAIEQRDLCTITANLIKNAVEAVSQLEWGDIVFMVNRGKKYLSINVENSFTGECVIDKAKMPKTTKKEKKNHGMGLKNVKEIVQKYEGEYNIDIKEGRFIVEVSLKI